MHRDFDGSYENSKTTWKSSIKFTSPSPYIVDHMKKEKEKKGDKT